MTMLRSINILEDLRDADVVGTYRPTPKTLGIVKAICGLSGSAATNVVAAYGSGKSLAALAGATLVRRSGQPASDLVSRIEKVDAALAAALRRQSSDKGMVVLLQGYCPDLPYALATSSGVRSKRSMASVLKAILDKARRHGHARVAVIWDEFGQHLETLVTEGRPEALLAVQELAEWAVRRSAPTVTFTTLMHQGVHHYARRIDQSARNAWRKIEGRFETLALLDDGAEAYGLIADSLERMEIESDAEGFHGPMFCPVREKGTEEIPTEPMALAAMAHDRGLFPALDDTAALAQVLRRTARLTPAALDALPRVAARVAQNERTVFAFLEMILLRTEGTEESGLDDVYDYFSPAMRADTGPGGTHRRFVEAESALSRTEAPLERQVIKAVAILQLGAAGERMRLPRERLAFCVAAGTATALRDVEAAIDGLLARKILIHRRRIDDVAIWHGSDLDIEGLLAEEAARVAIDQDLVADLERLFPPDPYLAERYNFDFSMTRFARARYTERQSVISTEGLETLRSEAGPEDALVALVLDSTAEDADLLAAMAEGPSHLVFALPRRPAEVAGPLTELRATERLLERQDLIDSDPLFEREIRELQSEAFAALREGIERLVNPDRGAVVWIAGGERHDFSGGGAPGEVLSRILEQRFSDTPRIRNEQVVRRRITAVTRSARRRCLLGVIERGGMPSLGYEGATSADASLSRTVFENTGLYGPLAEGHGWRGPDDLEDAGLRKVWEILRDFFATPAEAPKSFADLVSRLSEPPIGLRTGVMPLLGGAGLQAFGSGIAITEEVEGKRRYVDDIQPSVVELMFEHPDRFEIEVHAFDETSRETLCRIVADFSELPDAREPDPVRAFYDALQAWMQTLPASALRARGLGVEASAMQPLLRRRPLNPMDLLARQVPRIAGRESLDGEVRAFLDTARRQIEGVIDRYVDHATLTATELFNGRTAGEPLDLLPAAERWAACLPDEIATDPNLDRVSKGVLSRARSATTARGGQRGFVTTLSGILFGLGFEEWDDGTAKTFGPKLETTVIGIEDAAMAKASGSEAFEPFIRNRIAATLEEYRAIVGDDALRTYVNDVIGGQQ